ncbi:hypothetical protein [Janthinobacterium sp.]|uniref:hypothetical protein n=1 Tax=Janthinobacterium sp. TaxID=1871054 RepID=UPI00258A5BED|nr:hypothetical protein [Janthinobacterium sp.]MCX7293659.1 hypothetical protein [Janthinobacterium sp.]
MSRPAFALRDAEARLLVEQMAALTLRHAHNVRNHRPFVRDFIAAVFHATGKTYSAPIYRRLLGAYAPERRPSTSTLAAEKTLFEQQLPAMAAVAPLASTPGNAELLSSMLRRVVDEALAGAGSVNGDAGSAQQQRAYTEYLRDRLESAESALAASRASTARLAADLQEAVNTARLYHDQLEVAQAAAAAQATLLGALPQALHDMRQFSLRAIDEVRGETRAVRERCAYLEETLKERETMLETFRQVAYRHGAPIPGQRKGGPAS